MNEYPCGHDHSNESDPALQTVTLDDDRTVALFTGDGRVFFDLGYMVRTYNDALDQNIEMHKEAGTLDEHLALMMRGQEALINAIAESGRSLLLDYSFSLDSAER